MNNDATATHTTAVDTTTGDCLLVQINDNARTIAFLDDDDALVATYTYDTFAQVNNAMCLNTGRNIIIDAATVAGVQQFARLDAR